MLKAVIGKPGSGKTVYIVSEYLTKFIGEGGFVLGNIKLAPNVTIDNYKYLDFEGVQNLHISIKNIMKKNISHDEKKILLREQFQKFIPVDSKIIKYAFVIDEAHLYGYRKVSRGDTWQDDFISIHRHLFSGLPFDIVLITQVASRIASELALQCEFAVNVAPSTGRFAKGLLEYTFYDSLKSLSTDDKFGKLGAKFMKPNSDIYDIYESGFNMQGSNALRHKIYALIVGIVLVSAYVVFAFWKMFHPSTSHVSDVVSHAKLVHAKDLNISVSDDSIYDYVCTVLPNRVKMPLNRFSYKVIGKDNTSYCKRVLVR